MVNCAASHTLYIKDGLSHRDFTIWEFWDFVTGFSNQTLTMHDCILLAKTGVQTSLIGCMSDSILLLLLTGQINFYSRFKMTELTKVSACQHRCCHTPSFLFLAFKKHPCALHHGSLWGLAFRLSKFWLKSGASRLLFGINRSIVDLMDGWTMLSVLLRMTFCCVTRSSLLYRKAGLSTGLTLQGTVHPELAHSGELVCYFSYYLYRSTVIYETNPSKGLAQAGWMGAWHF